MLLLALSCSRPAPAPAAPAPVPPAPAPAPTCQELGQWTEWAPGLDVGLFQATTPSPIGDSEIVLVRIDPARWDLGVARGDPQTARAWASHSTDVVAVTNAGMFHTDHRTHVGALTVDGVQVGRDAPDYQSLAVFGDGRFDLVDLDTQPDVAALVADNRFTVQNLRLIKHTADNRWTPNARAWSEAALAQDADGNAVFAFSRSPYTMARFNDELIALGLVAAQHLEGGPEAQLYVRAGDCTLEQWGSFETSFVENDDNATPWPVPVVLTVQARQPAGQSQPSSHTE